MDISDTVLEAFQIEHKEQLEGIRSFLAVASEATDCNDPGLEEAFRLAHSLKGGARVCSLSDIEVLGHHLEALFAKVRAGTMRLDEQINAAISATLDQIEDWMVTLAQNAEPQRPVQAIQQLECLLSGESAATPIATTPSPTATAAEHAAVEVESTPPDTHGAAQAFDTVRLRAQSLDSILEVSDQLQTEVIRQDQIERDLLRARQHVRHLQHEWESVRRLSTAALHELSNMPKYDRLLRYLDFHDHQIRQLVREERLIARQHKQSNWSMQRLCQHLRQDVRSARMTSADVLYQGFRKMVRDLAQDVGKAVRFDADGLGTEADRMVLQALKDPLMHVLRNSIAHGIEAPDVRREAGKPETGQVTLSLHVTGGRLRVTVDDDGKGIDADAIRRRACETGLISASKAAELNDYDATQLIFRTGLSTTQTVDSLSGRGMGLSVVSEAVSRLRGQVSVMAGPDGIGTRVAITVPVSIATHRLLIVSACNQTFAVPMEAVSRLLRIKADTVETVEGVPVIHVDGAVIPLFTLSHLLGIRSEADESVADEYPVMLVHRDGRLIALRVGAFIGERDTVVRNLTGPAAHMNQYAGCIAMEDSSWALVISPEHLHMDASPDQPSQANDTPKTIKNDRPTPRVLVVDDSFTTRTLEKSILEAHGYIVFIAVDGQEALKRLQTEEIDLVISDVEMPRLDGFGLLDAMKKNPHTRSIPVIMVTSRDRKEDQRRGLELGADAYIVKQKFDHQDLLHVIKQCV